MTSTNPSLPSTADVRRLLDAELSQASRLGYVALVLASLTMTVVVSSLWLTEPGLPTRTRVAFALMIIIGLSWTAFAVWGRPLGAYCLVGTALWLGAWRSPSRRRLSSGLSRWAT